MLEETLEVRFWDKHVNIFKPGVESWCILDFLFESLQTCDDKERNHNLESFASTEERLDLKLTNLGETCYRSLRVALGVVCLPTADDNEGFMIFSSNWPASQEYEHSSIYIYTCMYI